MESLRLRTTIFCGAEACGTPNPRVAFVMTDLLGRIDVDPGSVEVVSIEEVTWPDGSVGCPQPDMRYTQALVNGSRIVLRVDGADY